MYMVFTLAGLFCTFSYLFSHLSVPVVNSYRLFKSSFYQLSTGLERFSVTPITVLLLS